MIFYLFRRILYAIPILIAVNLITFVLFFMVNTPDDVARAHLGQKHISQADIENWKITHGYNKPLFYNPSHVGKKALTETLFFQKSLKLFLFDFGRSDSNRDISDDILQRMLPSLWLAIPILIVGLVVDIFISIIMVMFRDTSVDVAALILTVILMSVSALFYVIGMQYLFAKILQWVPISGYQEGFSAIKFLVLPIIVAVLASLGGNTRWYRTLFLEEIAKDYVRTARAKGLSEFQILRRHVLKNAMIPILTGIVVIIPMLFMGSLILESFFGIPGLGSYTIDAIQQQDFAIVRAMVFLGTVFYIIGLVLTDFTYVLVDPRVRFN